MFEIEDTGADTKSQRREKALKEDYKGAIVSISSLKKLQRKPIQLT